jgi:hypothetical protein
MTTSLDEGDNGHLKGHYGCTIAGASRNPTLKQRVIYTRREAIHKSRDVY